MKYEGLTQKFVDFVDDIKIAKINKLINGDSSIKTNIALKKGIKGSIQDMGLSKEIFQQVLNEIHNYDVDSICIYLTESFLDKNGSFFFAEGSKRLAKEWVDTIEVLKDKWKQEQSKNDYKAQSLKIKITNGIKKSLKDVDGYSEYEPTIIIKAKRAIESGKLNYDLSNMLDEIQITVPELLDVVSEARGSWSKKLGDINRETNYANWLDNASEKAVGVTYATHVAKLTHTKIEGTDICFSTKNKCCFLTTNSIKNKTFDLSGDAGLNPIKTMLKISCEGYTVVDKLLAKDISFLNVFAKDQEQLEKWLLGLSNVFESRYLSTDHLAKQIFFQLRKGTYHLISPLMSSSLDQAIIEKVMQTKSYNIITKEKNDDVIEIRNQRYKDGGKYHAGIDLMYPDIAILKVTSTPKAHPNASPLNAERQGQRFLFTSAPPHWESSLKPPIKKKSFFYEEFDRRAWHLVKDLQKYLLELQGQKSNKVIRDQVKDHVNKIIGTLFNYVAEVQAIEGSAGWSEQTEKPKNSHKLWLDPYRDDELFQTEREKGDWQQEVCQDFGTWMNKKLKHKKMQFSNIEGVQWAKLLKGRLREFERDLEVSR